MLGDIHTGQAANAVGLLPNWPLRHKPLWSSPMKFAWVAQL